MRALAPAILLVALFATRAAQADDEELARRHFQTGQLLYDRSRYEDALHEFEAARAVLQRPPFDYNIGLCLEFLGRWDEAADAFARFANSSLTDADAAAAWKRVATLREHRPRTVASPRPLSPTARALRISGGVLTAFGGALLVSAIPTGLQALSARDDYRADCATRVCDPSLYSAGHGLAITTDVLIGVGTTLAVAGVTLLGVSAAHPAPARVVPDAVRPY